MVKKCLSIPVEFNTFKVLPNNTISCNFTFYSQDQTIPFLSFQQIEPFDNDLVQKKLLSLKFNYDIPNTRLSFHVPGTHYSFVWNASYNSYVGDKGCSYSTFLANYKRPQTSESEAPPTSDPSQSSSIDQVIRDFNNLPPYTQSSSMLHTPPAQQLEQCATPFRPAQETTRSNLIHTLAEKRYMATVNLISRLATENAIEQHKETAGVSLASDFVIGKLENMSNWLNKDLALLVLATNGIIPVLEPTGTLPPDDHQVEEDHEDEIVT